MVEGGRDRFFEGMILLSLSSQQGFMMVEPAIKRRKLEPNGHFPLSKQESFTAVLEQLEAEEDATGGLY